jgi:hypothetical protein
MWAILSPHFDDAVLFPPRHELMPGSCDDLAMMRGLVSLICASVVATSASAATAATFTVSGFGDPSGATCSGTSCSSLRAAIAAANAVQNAGSTIDLGTGTYSLGGAGSAGGPLSIALDTTIAGAGESATSIEQTGAGSGVLRITSPTATVKISDLSISGGDALGTTGANGSLGVPGGPGGPAVGGILDDGALTLSNVAVTGNRAFGGTGGSTESETPGSGGSAVGGIEVAGSLNLQNSAVTSNIAVGGTGGTAATTSDGAAGGPASAGVVIDPGAGAVSITGSDLSGNSATGGAGAATTQKHGGTGGDAHGALVDLGGQSLSVAGSTLNSNTVIGGAGGAGPFGSAGEGAGGSAAGGGIDAGGGALTVSDVSIAGNSVTGGDGGASGAFPGHGGPALGGGIAVLSPATLALHRATIALNTATGGSASTVEVKPPPALNGADAQGGGVYTAATSSFVDMTLTEDTATGGAGTSNVGSLPGSGFGGGMSAQPGGGGVVLAGDTFATNAVQPAGGSQTGGGNLDDAGPLQVSDTIFTNGIGSTTTGNCALFGGQFSDAGHNLESTTPSECGLTLPSDLVGVDPQLGSLTNNGGPGTTLAPAPASRARGTGGACTDPSQIGNPLLTVDERGSPRHPQCDIGAYETQPPSVTSAPTLAGPVVVGATLTCMTPGFGGDAPLALSYKWLRGGAPIAGASTASYTTVSADGGQALSCSATAVNAYGSATAGSNAVTVTPATITPPSIKFTGALLGSAILTTDGKGHLSISLSCPKSTPGGSCAVTLGVYSAGGSLKASLSRVKKTHRAALLAHGVTRITAGGKLTMKLTLTATGRRAIKHLPAHVRVLLSTRDKPGAVVTRLAQAIVRRAKPHRRRP